MLQYQYFQEISERSCCSSLISCESECKVKVKKNDNSKKLGDICQKDTQKESSNVDIIEVNTSHSKKEQMTSSLTILNVDEEDLDTFEEQETQEWRKSRGKSVIMERSDLAPSQPGTATDIWSVGCLLTEAMTGHKLYQTGDKLATVLRPAQLLEMKLGGTEIAWTERGDGSMFTQLKDLILNCISEYPSTRITADEALNHPIFKVNPDPNVKEMQILQSPILQFSRYVDDNNADESIITEEMLDKLRAECESYGDIAECKVVAGGHAFVHFQEVGQAVLARNCLLKLLTKTDLADCVNEISYFNNQYSVALVNHLSWDISFCPLDVWHSIV